MEREKGGGRRARKGVVVYVLECLCSCLKREKKETEGEAEHPVRTGQAVRADDGGTPFSRMHDTHEV